jgi:hypothetical protein
MPSHAVGLPGNRQHRMVIGFGVFRVVIRICPEAQHAPEAPARPLGRSELFCINVASLACPTPSSHRQLLRRPPPRLRTSPRSRAMACPLALRTGAICALELRAERQPEGYLRGQFVPSRRRRMMANVRAERLLKIPAEPAPSCVSPALQLKREWSPWPQFGSDPGNPRELSKG